MVGVNAIAGSVLLVGSAGRIPPEETWCWETRCYPAALPAITVAHSEVMIGKRCCRLEAPTRHSIAEKTVWQSPWAGQVPVGGAYGDRILLDVFLNGLWDRQCCGVWQ